MVESACNDRIIRADALLMNESAALAAEHGITAYDAAYAAAARKCGWPLVSCDIKDLVSRKLAIDPSAALASV